ncbi:SDR family NAD(P)-dependent oxidoreductase [Glaciecola petra]|uniref:SDR family oxidoreductase n=1 Tax=Glaciecola petra TaxID=3075602 RepID=A0ABU2ZXH1_9ALTE|nr:SDR family oxidoreductase [Aestuariibacter sp. P117]MDT0596122.1 SDR family oxidoreductase [Aestuariibacter sp. P117]
MKKYANYPSLEGKAVFITGGATGIGAVMVEAFCKQGAKVLFVDIAEKEGRAVCLAIEKKCGNAPQFQHIDVTNIDALKTSIENFAKAAHKIDVLINNVGNDNRHSPLDIDQNQWRKCMAINLDAAFFASQAAIPFMQKQCKGNIINMSTINVIIAPEQMPGYVAAKSALNGLSKSLANEYGVDGIRVNSIMPGWVATERQIESYLTPKAQADWQKSLALKETLRPIHVANMALFLAADDSEMVTGQAFIVDAGRT